MKVHFGALPGLLVALAVGCGGGDDGAGAPAPAGGGDNGALKPILGAGAERVEVIYTPPAARSATDLAFNTAWPSELWVLLREFPTEEPCTSDVRTGCSALIGRTVIFADATAEAPQAVVKTDPNAWHFMRRPTSIAFGPDGLFATCHEARTGNFLDEVADYIGPTLWTSDPEIYAIEPPGKNGSHLDMLHATPFCMGIAHEQDNVYWAFNGDIGALDRYDFAEPHEVGGDDHSDGSVWRYVEGEVERVAEVPSHMVLDGASRRLYVADTGHARVVAVDIDAGEVGDEIEVYDPMVEHRRMEGVELEEVVPPGVLQAPSGIELHAGVLYVGDHATGVIHAFDLEGRSLGTLDTGLGSEALSGIAVGPDERLYFLDAASGRVLRSGTAD